MTKNYKDFITSTLRRDGVCYTRTDSLDINTVNRFTRAHGIDFSVVKGLDAQGYPKDFYRFWIDTQQKFRHKLAERRKWRWWGKVVAIAILAGVASLTLMVLLKGGN